MNVQFIRFDEVTSFTLAEGVEGSPLFEHSAYCGPEGATVIDVFCPVREDYRERWAGSSAANG